MFKNKKTILLGMMTAYGAMIAGMYLRQRDILYRAPKKSQINISPIEILIGDNDNPQLLGWVENEKKEDALIYYGGSSEPIELRMETLKRFFPEHTIYLVPYRGFGPNSKLKHEEISLKKDAVRLYNFARSRHNGNIDVIGRSLGTGMAVHVAANCNVPRLGLITPYDSILEVARGKYLRMLPVEKLLWDKFETWKEAHLVKSEITVISAEKDIVTPHQRWKNLEKFLTSAKKINHALIPGSNHTNIVDWDHTWEELKLLFNSQKN